MAFWSFPIFSLPASILPPDSKRTLETDALTGRTKRPFYQVQSNGSIVAATCGRHPESKSVFWTSGGTTRLSPEGDVILLATTGRRYACMHNKQSFIRQFIQWGSQYCLINTAADTHPCNSREQQQPPPAYPMQPNNRLPLPLRVPGR